MTHPIQPRGRQLLPTQPEQRAYLKRIREAADGGDVIAMAAMVALARLRPSEAERDLHRLGLNADDTKAEVLAAVLSVAPQLRALLG